MGHRTTPATHAMTSELYGSQLAGIHHAHFGDLARAAAAELLELLGAAGRRSGTVVELGSGGGLSSRILFEAGYDVLGVDVSAAMVELARRHVPGARFVQASLWDFELPEAVAVTALGEAFCYHSHGQAPDLGMLSARCRSIATALPIGGVLLFDVATPGRSGPAGHRSGSWQVADSWVYVDEREDPASGTLVRNIDSFVPLGDLYRRSRESHRLTLYEVGDVLEALDAAGFESSKLGAFGEFPLRPGWVGMVGIKK